MSAPTTQILIGDALDALRTVADGSVNEIVTSPPYYGKRDYEVEGQIGFGQSLDDYISSLVAVFRETRRVLRKDGTMFLNLGDTYYDPYFVGQVKDDRFDRNDLMLVPFRVAMALQADGWLLRSHVVWHKPAVLPESVKNRPTCCHEEVFFFVKKMGYYYDYQAIAEPSKGYKNSDFDHKKTLGHQAGRGRSKPSSNARVETDTRNSRNVWKIPTEPSREDHFAMMPSALATRCVLAGCPASGVVLDPFGGAGTTALSACRAGRSAVLIELNPQYAAIAERRLAKEGIPVTTSAVMPTAATAAVVPMMSRAA